MIKKYIYFQLYKKLDNYISDNISYEINDGSFIRVKKAIDRDLNYNISIYNIIKKYFYFKKRLLLIPKDIPKQYFKILLFYNKEFNNDLLNNYCFEKEFSKKNIIVKRITCKNNKDKIINKYIKKGYILIVDIDNYREISYTIIKGKNIPIIKIYIRENITLDYIYNIVNFIHDFIRINNNKN